MNNISLTIDSAKFEKFLGGAPQKVAIALKNVIYKVTLLVERSAKQNAPVDTGRLRSSIATDIRPTSSTIRTNTNYAVFVHEGTRYMSARPFMTDAVQEVSGQVKEITGLEIERQLK